jgi:4-carboxymuconolactone decarboxylase
VKLLSATAISLSFVSLVCAQTKLAELSKRDRSLVKVAALIALNRPEQLRSHLTRARDNGVTPEELIETITHLAFYSGWPNPITAVGVAREVFEKK